MSTVNTIALPKGTILQKNYKILSILGQGGFGITYLAHDEALNQKVAIKEYLPSSLATRDQATHAVNLHNVENSKIFQWGLKRFLEEARILAKLSHHNIVRVFHFIALNETGYMIMQYEEGVVLKKWIERFPGNQIPQDEIYKLLGPLLDALDVVHKAGLAHRDIKPDNIYIREDDSPVLLDFGAARNIDSGQSHTMAAIVASGYSPNEQYGNVSEQGSWTDIYALGAVLYRLITGSTPPDAPSRIDANMSDIPDPCEKLANLDIKGYDPEFLAAVDWALSLRAKDRPQCVSEWMSSFGEQGQMATQIITQRIETSALAKTEIKATAILNEKHPSLQNSKVDKTANEGKKSSGSIVKKLVSACLFLLIISAGGYAAYLYSLPVKDLIGNDLNSARQLGNLSETELTISDFIGGKDESDVLTFTLMKDSELKLALKNAPLDVKLRVFDQQQKLQKIYKTKQGYISELPAGNYSLQISSLSSTPSEYQLQLKSLAANISLRPQNTLETALDLKLIGDAAKLPVRYRGKLLPGQKEHFFRLELNKAMEISLKANTEQDSGRISITDEFGIALKSQKMTNDQVAILSASVPKGTYHIIVNADNEQIFEYGLELKLDKARQNLEALAATGPVNFIPLEKPKGRFFNVKATALLDKGMSKEEAVLAAKSLARMKLIDAAISANNAPGGSAARLANIIKFFPQFDDGVTYDESWSVDFNESKVAVSLKARFENTKENSFIEAALLKNMVKAREPIQFNIEAKKDLYLGIFGWQADGTVLRIYPRKRGRDFIITEGQKIQLPLAGETPFLSVPIPGRSSSSEAIFVVGCYSSVDYSTIAPSLWEPGPKSISSSTFYQRLATSCQQHLTIKVMPYVVFSE